MLVSDDAGDRGNNESEPMTPQAVLLTVESSQSEDIKGRDEPESDRQVGQKLEDTFQWMLDHVRELRTTPSGLPQLEYMFRKPSLFRRLSSYREAVERSYSQRSVPQTWASSDTTFLP